MIPVLSCFFAERVPALIWPQPIESKPVETHLNELAFVSGHEHVAINARRVVNAGGGPPAKEDSCLKGPSFPTGRVVGGDGGLKSSELLQIHCVWKLRPDVQQGLGDRRLRKRCIRHWRCGDRQHHGLSMLPHGLRAGQPVAIVVRFSLAA
jgi:hypothetical protein